MRVYPSVAHRACVRAHQTAHLVCVVPSARLCVASDTQACTGCPRRVCASRGAGAVRQEGRAAARCCVLGRGRFWARLNAYRRAAQRPGGVPAPCLRGVVAPGRGSPRAVSISADGLVRSLYCSCSRASLSSAAVGGVVYRVLALPCMCGAQARVWTGPDKCGKKGQRNRASSSARLVRRLELLPRRTRSGVSGLRAGRPSTSLWRVS